MTITNARQVSTSPKIYLNVPKNLSRGFEAFMRHVGKQEGWSKKAWNTQKVVAQKVGKMFPKLAMVAKIMNPISKVKLAWDVGAWGVCAAGCSAQ